MFFVKTDQEDCAYLEGSEVQTETSEETPQKDTENVRTALTPDAPEATLEMKNTKEDEKMPAKKPQITENLKKKPINTVPERIMEVADTAKQDAPINDAKIKNENISEAMSEKMDENMKQTETTA